MKERGFTLIELLVVVAVLGILAAVGLPSFQNAYMTNRLASYANNFVASAQYARSEAIKRGSTLTVCASTAAVGTVSSTDPCASGGSSWPSGWIVRCTAATSTATTCGTGTYYLVLQKQDAISSQYAFFTCTDVNCTAAASSGAISFTASGVGTTTAYLKLCRQTPSVGEQHRVITVTASGRTTVTTVRPSTPTCPY